MRNPDNLIHQAVRTAHAAGQQQALTGVYAALGRTLAAQLNLAPAVAKAHDRAQPPSDPDLEADPHAALLLAQIDHQIRCRESNTDAGPGDRALHALWHDPESLAAVLSPHVHDEPQFAKAIAYAMFLKAAEHAPKGGITLTNHATGQSRFYPGGSWIPSQAIAEATPEEKTELAERKAGARPNPLSKREKASAAAADKRGTRDETRKRVAQIATHIMLRPDLRTPDMYRDLADAIRGPHLSVPDLRALRLKLSASFGGGRRKEQMVAALLQHAADETSDLNNPQPEPPALPGAPKQPKAPKPGTFAVLKTGSLSIDPARFQFKLKTDASGVTEELKDVEKFDPDFAGVIAVWFDPETNSTFVVNGHHRYELAKRSGYPSLAVRYLDAKDAREARARGALINIAEGRGTPIDAAKFIRDSGGKGDELFKFGISQKSPLARDAAVLTRLNDAAFDRLARGGLSMDTALAVAKHVEDPARQEKLFRLIGRKEDAGEKFTQKHVEEMARQMASAPSATTTSSGLFGDITEEDDAFTERADLASHVRSELAKEHGDFKALSSERRAGATAEAGNVLNTEENKNRADAAEVHKHAYDTLAHRKGPVSDALDAGAVAIKQARTKKEKERVRSQTLARVRSAVAVAAAGRVQPADAPGVGAVDGGRDQGSGAEPGASGATSTGEAAADGRGAGDGEAGVKPLPSVADIIAHPESPQPSIKPSLKPPGGGENSHEEMPAAPATSSPNVTPPAASAAPDAAPAGGPAEPASPLHALAHFAGNSAALAAESEKLADSANKTSSQGGSLDFHDAMTAALRGEHGPEVRDAVSRALDDWDSHKGSTAKRYARVAEEVSKLGKEAEPQAEAKEDAPAPAESQPAVVTPEAKPEALGQKKLSLRSFEGRADDAAPSDEEFAAASKPAKPLPSVADVTADPAEHAAKDAEAAKPEAAAKATSSPNGSAPSGDLLSLTPESVRGVWEHNRDEILARDKKKSPAQAGALAAARILNARRDAKADYIDAIDKRVKDGGEVSPEEDEKYINLGDERGELQNALVKLSGYRPHPEADDHPEAKKPVAFPGGRASAPAAPAAPSNPHYKPASREEERHVYAAKMAREITGTPDMTRDEKRAAAALAPISKPDGPHASHAAAPSSNGNGTGGGSIPAGKPPKEPSSPNAEPDVPAEVKHGRDTHHVPAILAIPKGDSRYIAGFRVRHTPEGKFQIERKGQRDYKTGSYEGGFQTGTAKQIGEQINDQWRDIAKFNRLPAALSRASSYEEPDPFTDLARADSDAKARSATPDGTRAVSLDDHTRGRIGTVRHDAETGNTWLQFDGAEEERGRDFEPLDEMHSWRSGKREKANKAKTESLFGE